MMEEFNDTELLKLDEIAKSTEYHNSPLVECQRDNFDTQEEQMEALRTFPFNYEQILRLRPLLLLESNKTLTRVELLMMLPHIKFLFGKIPSCVKSSVIRHREFLRERKYRIVKRIFHEVGDNDTKYFIKELRRCIRSYRRVTETRGHLQLSLQDPSTFVDLMPRIMNDRWVRS